MNFIDAKGGKQHYLKLGAQAFVVGVNSDKRSAAITLNNPDRHDLKNFVHTLQIMFGGSTDIDFKVIGPSFLINAISTILEKVTSKKVKKVIRAHAYEVFFFPEDGKIRVSKEVPEKSVTTNEKVKVLVVDDSKTIRNLLTKVIGGADGLEVCATAEKPSDVEKLIEEHKPDVITLDIHMPEMTGVELLKIIGPKYNIPTIMITSISIEEGPLVLEALEHGAFDYIQKPEVSQLAEVAPMMIGKIKEAATSRKTKGQLNKIGTKPVERFNTDSMVVIGSSTGGTNALKDILTKLPGQIPPILIVQHIPPVFSKAFADRMNNLCQFSVKEAEDGDAIEPNNVYVAPGGMQMKAVNRGGRYVIEITDDAPVNRFKPSVDYLFKSVVPLAKRKHIVGVILTGMGKDGAREMLNLKNAGAYTIAQDEESCIVFGMPKEAIALGGAKAVEHKDDIPHRMAEYSWPNKNEKAG